MKSGHLGSVHNVYKLRFSRRHPTGTSPFSLDIINMFAKLWDALSVVYTSMYSPVSHCSDWASNQSLPAEYQNPQTHPDVAFPRCGEKASEKCSVCFTIFPMKIVSIINSSLGYPIRLLIEKRLHHRDNWSVTEMWGGKTSGLSSRNGCVLTREWDVLPSANTLTPDFDSPNRDLHVKHFYTTAGKEICEAQLVK